MQNASPDQINKAFQLCDILGIEDVTMTFSILQQLNWDLEKAIEVMQGTSKNVSTESKSSKNETYDLPPNYTEPEEAFEYAEGEEQYEEYEYEIPETNNNRKAFDQAYEEMMLDRSTSEPPNQLERKLSLNRQMIAEFSKYRHAYQVKLLEESQKLCEKILGNNPSTMKKVDENKAKNEKNKNFIGYLSQNYRCSINFTFGTFMLNLVRSYLDKKILLVYIHQLDVEESRCLRMLLSHKETSKFINTYCISYGMFDNSDDYEIVQKYVPMRELPAFALFKFSNKNRKEKFISSYQILQKQPENFLEWLAAQIGVPIKKKQEECLKKQEGNQHELQELQKKNSEIVRQRDIMSNQNKEYEEMERIYKLKRQQSSIKKEEIKKAEQLIEETKLKFKEEIKFEDGVTIELRFRLPETGKSIQRVFLLSDKVKEMFDYVSAFGRDQFQQKFASFDLTQTFPRLSLLDKQNQLINEVFEGSSHENIIVKEF